MKAKDFIEYYRDREIYNGADYRGAPIPAPIKNKINQASIPDELRLKYYEFCDITPNSFTFDYTSQEWIKCRSDFFKEVERFFNYIAEEEDLEEIITITVVLRSRDGGGQIDRKIIEISV